MLSPRFRSLVLVLLLLGTLLTPGAHVARAAGRAAAPVVEGLPGQVIVSFEPGASGAARDAIVAGVGGRTLREVASLGVRLVELPPGLSVAASVGAFQARRGVRYAEPNTIVHASLVPNDPSYGPYQWGLNNVGQTINGVAGTPGADIAAQAVWEITTGSQAVVVGVLDSGIDAGHPDLAENLWSAPVGWSLMGCGGGTHGYDAISNDCVPQDENGHGTHVAGTIGARGNNATGVTGVNWSVGIMALRFLDATGSGSLYDEITAIDYAVRARQLGVNLRVLNGSYGSSTFSQTEHDAIGYAGDNGILFVAAAGNNGANNDATPSYPASYDLPNVISVAATTNRDELAGFSNYGATSVDLGAPGKDIVSTLPTYPVPLNGNSANAPYGSLSGTSMAAPHVAGAAALLLAAPGLGALTVADLRARLLDCGDSLPALAGKTVTGRRLDVRRALDRCSAPPPAFADVPGDYWAYGPIEQFAARGITIGCGTNGAGQLLYCPDRNVTRAEMAVFIDRTLGQGPLTDGRQTFADVPPDYWAHDLIERFYTLGITTGCGTNAAGQLLYCPDRNVTRAEMAVFLNRAKGYAAPTPPASATFFDVPPTYWAYAFIEQFATLGITTGCGTDDQGRRLYCPDRNVTRAEMAVFIIRAYP